MYFYIFIILKFSFINQVIVELILMYYLNEISLLLPSTESFFINFLEKLSFKKGHETKVITGDAFESSAN